MREGRSGTSWQGRSGAYRLLAQLALAEVEPDLVGELKAVPALGEALAAAGGQEALQPLRVEYTRTFLTNVPPYESVYLDESGLLNASRSAAVLAHYAEHGFDPPAARTTGAPDHLGLELEFMAHLVEHEAAASQAGESSVGRALREAQLHFLEAHLARWAPMFGALLSEAATSPFYRALGQTIETFVLKDYESLTACSRGADAPP